LVKKRSKQKNARGGSQFERGNSERFAGQGLDLLTFESGQVGSRAENKSERGGSQKVYGCEKGPRIAGKRLGIFSLGKPEFGNSRKSK